MHFYVNKEEVEISHSYGKLIIKQNHLDNHLQPRLRRNAEAELSEFNRSICRSILAHRSEKIVMTQHRSIQTFVTEKKPPLTSDVSV